MTASFSSFRTALCIALCAFGNVMCAAADKLPEMLAASTVSPLDGEQQQILYWEPPSAASTPRPLFVFLHSWSGDYRQDNSKWLRQAVEQEWIYLHPNFRGVNRTPKACGSRFARQDILDAIDWACSNLNADCSRIYLSGVSGGGHMSLLMAGHHPERFSAVAAWVGVSDLAKWHTFHTDRATPTKYARMIEQSLSGPPGTSEQIDAEYRDRSPVYHLHQVGQLPVSIWAGVNDGHTGSVPVTHALEAFNAIAGALGAETVSPQEIQQLRNRKKLTHPKPGDQFFNTELQRNVLLHRTAGASEVTIFDGGHESIPTASTAWLLRHQRLLPAPTGQQN
jgi:poly(3-hydroxybutyrate) depolymerase